MGRSLPCARTLSETLGGSGGHPCSSFLVNSSRAKTERYVRTLGCVAASGRCGFKKTKQRQAEQETGCPSYISVTDIYRFCRRRFYLYLYCVGCPGLQMILRPRLAIAMNGLDSDLYEQCLQVRRDFEARCNCVAVSTGRGERRSVSQATGRRVTSVDSVSHTEK
jgi:hypothetical protein